MLAMLVAAAVLLSLQLWMVLTPLRAGGHAPTPLLLVRGDEGAWHGSRAAAGVGGGVEGVDDDDDDDEWRHDGRDGAGWRSISSHAQQPGAHHRHPGAASVRSEGQFGSASYFHPLKPQHWTVAGAAAEQQVELAVLSEAAAAAAAAAGGGGGGAGASDEEDTSSLLPPPPRVFRPTWQPPPVLSPVAGARFWLPQALFGNWGRAGSGAGSSIARLQAPSVPSAAPAPAAPAAAAAVDSHHHRQQHQHQQVPDSWETVSEEDLLLPSPSGGSPTMDWTHEVGSG